MHPRVLELGRLWREGQHGLRCGTVIAPRAMAPLRLELRRLAELRGLMRPLAVAMHDMSRLDLPDYWPRRGVERRYFAQITSSTRPRRITTADWTALVALSIAAHPSRVVQLVCKARDEIFDHVEGCFPYLWDEAAGEPVGQAWELGRPVR